METGNTDAVQTLSKSKDLYIFYAGLTIEVNYLSVKYRMDIFMFSLLYQLKC